jgi:hypothetical protein
MSRKFFQLMEDQRSLEKQIYSTANAFPPLIVNWTLNWSSDLFRMCTSYVILYHGLIWQCSSFPSSFSAASNFAKDKRSLCVACSLLEPLHSRSA